MSPDDAYELFPRDLITRSTAPTMRMKTQPSATTAITSKARGLLVIDALLVGPVDAATLDLGLAAGPHHRAGVTDAGGVVAFAP